MIFTKEDKLEHSKATKCHICKGEITVKRIVCNGKAAHSRCGKRDSEESKDINWREFYKSESCSICNELFVDEKVRDHCYLTGKYKGAAHKSCNLNYKVPKFAPVYFHNLAGYDAHVFRKSLGKTEGTISCIPMNEENYISFSKKIPVDSFTDKDGKEH